MYNFSKTSKARLETCHPDLQKIFKKVIQHHDCTIVQGHRSEAEQNGYFDTGKSKVRYPNSKHNSEPSRGVDVGPYLKGKISWNVKHCCYFAGIVIGVADTMGIKIRWGGDWDMDDEVMTDQKFQDLVHFEVV